MLNDTFYDSINDKDAVPFDSLDAVDSSYFSKKLPTGDLENINHHVLDSTDNRTHVKYDSWTASSTKKINPHDLDVAAELIAHRLQSNERKNAPQWLVQNKWVGYVSHIDNEKGEFTARLQDVTQPDNPQEVAVFPTEDVSEADYDIFSEGATFTWSVGYSIQNKSKVRGGVIRFSRFKGASEKSIADAKKLAEELDDLFD